jgi:hypothetical protein
MSRKLITVLDSWREYDEGLGGMTSVKEAYEGDDQTWRKQNDSERKFYERRKPIWQEVKVLAEKRGITIGQAVELLEHYRVKGKMSLNQLANEIKSKKINL